jgi:hypothetical protein
MVADDPGRSRLRLGCFDQRASRRREARSAEAEGVEIASNRKRAPCPVGPLSQANQRARRLLDAVDECAPGHVSTGQDDHPRRRAL